MRILIAQDPHANSDITPLKSYLSGQGCDVFHIKDQSEIGDFLNSEEVPNIAILDSCGKDLDLAKICKSVRCASSLSYCYILLLTECSSSAATEVLEAGADDFLLKPFSEKELEIHLAAARRLAETHSRLVIKAATDPLTGVLNRDAIVLNLGRELARAQRNHSTVGLLMIDLDHFKKVNDLFGHQAGDLLLKEVLYHIIETIRTYDSIGRYGGDEFLVILPGCTLETGLAVAERIRLAAAKASLKFVESETSVTVSIGLVVNDGRNVDAEMLVELADQALYRAKSAGRNRVEAIQPLNQNQEFFSASSVQDQLKSEIQQRKQAQENLLSAKEALKESEKWFQTLSDVGPVGIFRTDKEGNGVYVNERWCDFSGLAVEDAVGTGWRKALHPEDRERVLLEWQNAVKNNAPFRSEYRYRKPDGTVTWLIGQAVAVRDDSGAPLGYIGTVTDITERKKAEMLQSALYRISEATTFAPDMEQLYRTIHKIVGELMDARNFYIALYDPATDLISFPYFVDEVDPPPDPQRAGKGLTAYVLRTKQTLLSANENWNELLETGEVELLGAPSLDWLGAPLTVGGDTFGVVVVQSYTETQRFGERETELLTFVSQHIATALKRKKAEEALIQSEQKFRTLIEESKDAIFISTPDGKVVDVNKAGIELFGYSSKEELLLVDIARDLYFNACDRETYRSDLAKNGFIKDYEVTLKRKDGQKLTVLETSSAVTDQNGEQVAYHGILRDITDLKYLQEQLLQSQKMETVGRLAGGIAHDFNNLLMAITGYCDLIELQYRGDQQLIQYIREVQKAADRGSGLTRQLLAFGSKQILKMASINLNSLIMDMDRMIERLLGEDIELVLNLDPDIRMISGDAGQLEQVILNLVVNAKDAMANGGTLGIETRNAALPISGGKEHTKSPHEQYVLLTISDTGLGMNEATKSRIFEPFFSTKEFVKGRGLGLSTVYGIVKQMKGHIVVQSEIGTGSTFYLYFESTDELVTGLHTLMDASQPALPSAISGNEVLLLVDDNETVRSSIGASLSMYGYKVLQAGCGEDAMKLCEQFPDPIDLMISDVVMPKMSGPDLAQQVRARRPGMKIVFMSGYSDGAVSSTIREDFDAAFLPKPVSAKALAEKIRELLDTFPNT